MKARRWVLTAAAAMSISSCSTDALPARLASSAATTSTAVETGVVESPYQPADPLGCSSVAAAGNVDLTAKAAFDQANKDGDESRAQEAYEEQVLPASVQWATVKRTAGCDEIVAAHDRVDDARQLVINDATEDAEIQFAEAMEKWNEIAPL